MKIIITASFKKDFKDVFSNQRFLDIFIKKLKETKFIWLGMNLYKFKFYIKMLSVRWIIFLNINDSYIPILITKKSDKNIWENLVLNENIKNILDTKFKKMKEDVQNKDYDIYS